MKYFILCLLMSFNASASLPNKSEYVVSGNSGDPRWAYRVPEGLTYDSKSNSFFITSLHGGKITKMDLASGQETLFFQEPLSSDLSFAGIKIDEIRRSLWVCSFNKTTAQVFQIHADTSKLIRTFPLPMPFLCNDIALSKNGDAYISNSNGNQIMKIALGSDKAQLFVESSMLLPMPKLPILIGPNGLAVTPDQKFLMTAVSVPARLARIRLDNPKDIQYVEFSGEAQGNNPIPKLHTLSFLAPDGLAFKGSELYICYHGAVQKLTFSLDFLKARASSTRKVPTGLSTLTIVQDRVYAIDSEIIAATQPQLKLPVKLPNKIVAVDL